MFRTRREYFRGEKAVRRVRGHTMTGEAKVTVIPPSAIAAATPNEPLAKFAKLRPCESLSESFMLPSSPNDSAQARRGNSVRHGTEGDSRRRDKCSVLTTPPPMRDRGAPLAAVL